MTFALLIKVRSVTNNLTPFDWLKSPGRQRRKSPTGYSFVATSGQVSAGHAIGELQSSLDFYFFFTNPYFFFRVFRQIFAAHVRTETFLLTHERFPDYTCFHISPRALELLLPVCPRRDNQPAPWRAQQSPVRQAHLWCAHAAYRNFPA